MIFASLERVRIRCVCLSFLWYLSFGDRFLTCVAWARHVLANEPPRQTWDERTVRNVGGSLPSFSCVACVGDDGTVAARRCSRNQGEGPHVVGDTEEGGGGLIPINGGEGFD